MFKYLAIVVTAAAAALANLPAAAHANTVEPNGRAHAVQPGSATRSAVINAAPPGYSVTGIDVSNHQGTINWAGVAAAGAKFAYAKATEGVHFVDSYFNANYDGAKNNGIYAGAYHFARPDRSGGRAQADYFLDRARYVKDGRTLPPMLDIEWPWEGSGSPSPCYGISTSQMVTWIRDFIARVRERTGMPTMIYTNRNWWNPCTGSTTAFGDNPLFIANYTSSPTPLASGWSKWTLWQYSDAGSLPGDQNVFNGTLAQLAQLAGGSGQAKSQSVVSPADFTGDGKADIGAQYANGDLRAWSGTGDLSADGRLFGGSTALAGTGWQPGNVERILVGDFTGDGRADIGAQYVNGDLRVWAGTGDLSADGRLLGGGTALVGTGWQGSYVQRILVADFTGDGKDDIGAQYVNGDLRVWASTGDLSADGRLFGGATALAGTGWQAGYVERILVGDFTGDGKADVGAQYVNGDLRVWAGTGDLSADGRLFGGATALVGTGWQSGYVQRII